MINDLNEVQWAYLLEPTFQIENTAGKPLTDGWIEVYIHGTRTKYYCASDFDGTLHPFKIPLDSLGSNIVLASTAHSYDIYIYNKFGTLVMSRYNIVPSTGDGSSIYSAGYGIDLNDNTISLNTDIFRAGNCIGISRNDNNMTFAFDVTAGITDIQFVDRLPAEPIATVLYLIAEK